MAKNIFIAATGKDVGKSTISFALIDELIGRSKEVGFMKPVGQRWLDSPWGKVEEDVILMKDGNTIDRLELNRRFFESYGVKVSGVIVNKTITEKLPKIETVIHKYCKSRGLKFFGIIPYSPILSHPTLGQIIDEIKPEIIHETGERKTVIDSFIVGASTIEEFVGFLEEKEGNLLLVFPAVRLDIIFAIPNLKKFLNSEKTRVHTILFSGRHRPSKMAIKTLIDEKINILYKGGETFSIISALSSISIKTRPEDSFKIDEIKKIVSGNLNYSSLLNDLEDISITTSFFKRWLKKIKNFIQKIKIIF